MNTIEKIRTEINRLYKEYMAKFKTQGDSYHLGICDGLDMAERGLDTLQEQEPEIDLEEAYQEFCKDYPFPWSSQYVNREYIDELCLSVARHFYELGLRRAAEMYDDVEYKRQRAQDKSSDDLEEAAREYAKIPGKVQHEWYDGGKLEGFKAGAEWMAAHTPLPEDTVIFMKGVEEGKRLAKEEDGQ